METARIFLEKRASAIGMAGKGLNVAMDFTTPSVIAGQTIKNTSRAIGKKIAGNNRARLMTGKKRVTKGQANINPVAKKQSVSEQLREKARKSSYSGSGMSKGRQAINNNLGNLFGMKNHAIL